MIRSRVLAGVVASAVLMNSVAFAGQSAGATVLQQQVKVLRSAIDSGSVKTEDAIDAFAKELTEKNVSVQDVDQYVKSRLTAREYQAFRTQMDAALKGVDLTQVKSEELGTLVAQALNSVNQQGLSWSSCASTWSGVAVVVASVVVGIVAIIKSKSTSSIQKDYNEKRAEKSALYGNLIDQANNWQTRIPNDIAALNDDIYRAYNDLQYYQNQYYYTDDPSLQQSYANYIRQLQDQIYSDNAQIANLNGLYARYLADPSLAVADAAGYQLTLDQALVDLTAQEAIDVANAPANQRLGRNLGIGAGVGAAVGTTLLVTGIRGGSCSAL